MRCLRLRHVILWNIDFILGTIINVVRAALAISGVFDKFVQQLDNALE